MDKQKKRTFKILLNFFGLWLFSQMSWAQESEFRIVTLAPHITELFFEVGAGHMVVGTVDYANYPEAAKKIERIGGYNSVSVERILALKPDFIVAIPGSAMAPQIDKLSKLGVEVRYSDPVTAQQVSDQLERIGGWVGKERQAKKVSQEFTENWQALKDQYQGRQLNKPKVFFQAWLKPLMTLNKDNLIHQVIDLCGGENVFAQLPMPVPHISIETVIAAAPDVIIYSGPQESTEAVQYWNTWQSIPAVKLNRVFWVHADDLARPVPQILKGAKAVCKAIHSSL